MGFRCIIFNKNKKQLVARNDDCWKNETWCDCHEVMHQFKWDKTDVIFSMDSCCFIYINFDQKSGKMKEEEKPSHDETVFEDMLSTGVVKYHSDYGLVEGCKAGKYDHVPKWVDNTCEVCGYTYEESKLDLYRQVLEQGDCI
jgi:hypothetical protein